MFTSFRYGWKERWYVNWFVRLLCCSSGGRGSGGRDRSGLGGNGGLGRGNYGCCGDVVLDGCRCVGFSLLVIFHIFTDSVTTVFTDAKFRFCTVTTIGITMFATPCFNILQWWRSITRLNGDSIITVKELIRFLDNLVLVHWWWLTTYWYEKWLNYMS